MKFGKMILLVGILTLAVMGGAFAQEATLATKVKDAMEILKTKTSALGAAKLEGESLFFGTTEMNNNFDIVDEVAKEKECTATIFAKKDTDYVRIATNVIKEGKRAVGTVLDPAGKAYEAINKGEAYYGQVDILGKQYEAGYEPLKDGNGAVVGVLYVGYKM